MIFIPEAFGAFLPRLGSWHVGASRCASGAYIRGGVFRFASSFQPSAGAQILDLLLPLASAK